MERSLKLQRARNWLQCGLDPHGLRSVLLGALLASCSSSNSPGASGGSGGSASSVAGGSTAGGQTTAGGTTSLAGATATGGSTAAGGVTTETGGRSTISSGGLAAGGNTAGGGTTSLGGTPAASGGVSSGGAISSAGGTVSTGGSPTTGGTAANAGATSTGGNSATGGSTRTGGATSTAGNSATGGSTRTGGATGTAGTTATGGATGSGGTTYDTSAVTTTCPGAVPAGITSTFCNCVNEGPGYKTSGFSVANNVWGSGAGLECVWATSTTLWGVSANHPQTNGVKSYPNIGLSPKLLISGINTYTSSFDITVPGNVGSWEAAYDIWLRTPGGGNTRIELMVWMYTYKTGPISSIVASTKPKIGDYTWTVHYGSNGSNATISLVNTSASGTTANVTSGTIDIKGILDWLIANNTTQYGQFDSTWTLDQVQWGFEISGDGGSTQEFINNSFSVSSS
jgi:hypothetical protein